MLQKHQPHMFQLTAVAIDQLSGAKSLARRCLSNQVVKLRRIVTFAIPACSMCI